MNIESKYIWYFTFGIIFFLFFSCKKTSSINKYKRFREEGFNFSPQYQYTFEHSISKEKYLGELTWIKNENFIDDFFPDNIESLTAVVGKNGTGKSHVLEVIILVLEILNYNGLENSAKGHSYKPIKELNPLQKTIWKH